MLVKEPQQYTAGGCGQTPTMGGDTLRSKKKSIISRVDDNYDFCKYESASKIGNSAAKSNASTVIQDTSNNSMIKIPRLPNLNNLSQ